MIISSPQLTAVVKDHEAICKDSQGAGAGGEEEEEGGERRKREELCSTYCKIIEFDVPKEFK